MARRGRISRAWSRGELDKAFNEVKDRYVTGVEAHSNDYIAGLKAYLTKYIPAVEAEFLKAVKETVGSDDPKQYAEASMYSKYEVARKVGEFTSKYARDQLISGLNEVFGIRPPEVPEKKVESPPPLPPPKIAENVIHDRDELLRLVKKHVFDDGTFVFYYKPLNAVVLYSQKTRKPYVTRIPALVQKYSSLQASTDVGPVVGVLANIILTPDDKITIDPRKVRVILVKKIEVPLDVALIAKITEMGLCLFARGADVFLYPNCNVEQEVGSIYKLTNSGPRLIEEKV